MILSLWSCLSFSQRAWTLRIGARYWNDLAEDTLTGRLILIEEDLPTFSGHYNANGLF